MKIKLAVFRLLALVAMGACMAMLLDDILPSPAFCGFKAGCEEVTHSAYGRPLGFPLPLWGLGAFGLFYGLTLCPTGRLGKLIGPAAILAGLGGLTFILLQLLVIRRVCPLCMVIDASALFIAATELIAAPAMVAVALSPRRRAIWAAAALAALVAAPLWAVIKPPRPVPETVQSLWTPDKITVVEVIDFDCPYCRLTHAALDELLADRKDRVQRVRFVLPLRAHKNARPAARAYFAAVQQGKGDEMAAALLAAKERSCATCERLAAELGLDMDSYKACVTDPATDREIDHRIAWLDEKEYPGLPVIWIENQGLLGAQTPASLRAAWERADEEKRNNHREADAAASDDPTAAVPESGGLPVPAVDLVLATRSDWRAGAFTGLPSRRVIVGRSAPTLDAAGHPFGQGIRAIARQAAAESVPTRTAVRPAPKSWSGAVDSSIADLTSQDLELDALLVDLSPSRS